MFRRYPYWGWLLLSLFLWAAVCWHFFDNNRAYNPAAMAGLVNKDLHAKEQKLGALLKKQDLLQQAFTQTLSTDEVKEVQSLPFYVYAFDNDTLIFWNNNKILPGWNDAGNDPKLLQYSRGYYVGRSISLPYLKKYEHLFVLFPIVTQYPFENDYLKSHFEAADFIPLSTQVSDKSLKGAYAVKDTSGKPLFYLHFNPQDTPRWVPDMIMLWLLVFALFATVSWLQLITIYIAQKRSFWQGLGLTLVIVIGGRAALYVFGLPFSLDLLPFFSPRLYASSAFLPSLGDLVLNTLCLLWISVFVIRHTPYKKLTANITSRALRIVLGILFSFLLVYYSFWFVNIIHNLVIDSNISFDLAHFDSIDRYTIIGLFTITIITGISCVVVYFLNIQAGELLKNKWLKYLLVIAFGLPFALLTKNDNWHFTLSLLAWILIMIVFLDIRRFAFVSDLFAPHMLFWAIFICAFCSGIIYHHVHVKEHDTRRIIAERIARQRDDVTEYAFQNIAQNIEKDRLVQAFFTHPTPQGGRDVNEHLGAVYLGGQLSKYQARLYFFDKQNRPLYNKDTVSYNSLLADVNKATASTGPLYYKEFAPDEHYYLAYMPVVYDSLQQDTAHIFIDLALKQATPGTVYPELLQPASLKASQDKDEYSYAIYVNDRLINQFGDYPFPVLIQSSMMQPSQYVFNTRDNASELWFKYSDTKTVIIVHNHSMLLEGITIFSYVFGIQMLVILLLVLYRLYITYLIRPRNSGRIIALTLRRRIHFSMLGIVLVSFTLIGLVTVYFFKAQYKNTNRNKLEGIMEVVEQSVQEYLRQDNAIANQGLFNVEAVSPAFKYFISTLANNQKVDINIFNSTGSLEVTSQDDIYDRALLAPVIRPDAYHQMLILGKSILVQEEKIGDLPYLSSYVPLRNEAGSTIGYINIPFFSSERDLDYQISNIIVTLINLYAFIFLISSIFTVLITRWITNIFNIIISQFGRLNLSRNERIQWPYNDEIGKLVDEYNKMVKKVEENAALLAQSEREMAWREMARQVAHEIKNPLTPMKLNIQYLQQALSSKSPNVEELTKRVSASLIEQIDNLSYIASEFSNFAKMPEARPEELELNSLLVSAVELYRNKDGIDTTLQKPGEKLVIYADKSQLLRVFTNLLENAMQALQGRENRSIKVVLQKEDGHAIISFADTGHGINSEVAARIFQPYFTTKTSGTGLGLAMTKKIIEFWQGEIWFDTEEDKGTTFYIRLPLLTQT